jgi:hypothetical protein
LYLFVKIKTGNESMLSGNKTENSNDKSKTIKLKSKDSGKEKLFIYNKRKKTDTLELDSVNE